MPIPANGAGRGPVDAGPLPEDEAAVQALGRLSRSNREKGLYHPALDRECKAAASQRHGRGQGERRNKDHA